MSVSLLLCGNCMATSSLLVTGCVRGSVATWSCCRTGAPWLPCFPCRHSVHTLVGIVRMMHALHAQHLQSFLRLGPCDLGIDLVPKCSSTCLFIPRLVFWFLDCLSYSIATPLSITFVPKHSFVISTLDHLCTTVPTCHLNS